MPGTVVIRDLTRIMYEAPRENGVQRRKSLRCTPIRGSFAQRHTVLDEIRGVGRKAGPAASA
ncbi:MAG: hypothetical protein K8T90_03290, partial [Planctomycetes bacterium]|nr:hypothetical protein [Planctomycetota bacterium]